ncbi:porin [Oricola thermophila]|uniref:Porin n=1 Tax=Oricola thermophila TaxID=2742145 RepID=A0A6N1VBW3_9HYPH|nr:porin [Oricola thermophila]QKV18496.1 porin [Oricola thermophila]
MKIKSLLLGSAAALVAVSGARAADAVIIPEPEMVEYVRVCDAAGTGYFYIPGTETCLKISGFVRYQMDFAGGDGYGDQDGWDKEYDVNLLFEAWNDTEYGPLYSQIRLEADGGVGEDARPLGDSFVNIDKAYFTLAGVTMGYKNSFWDYGFGGPADIWNNGGPMTGMVGYTANAGGFSISLALEDDGSADWTPAILGVVSGSIGDLALTLGAVYEDDGATGEVSDWGFKATAAYDMGAAAVGFGVQYSGETSGVNGSRYMTAYDWVLGADVSFDATEKLSLGLGAQYAINEGGATDDDWGIGAVASYDIVSGLNTELRLRWLEDTSTADAVDTSGWNARLRFTRSF